MENMITAFTLVIIGCTVEILGVLWVNFGKTKG